jgi:signal peptidase I
MTADDRRRDAADDDELADSLDLDETAEQRPQQPGPQQPGPQQFDPAQPAPQHPVPPQQSVPPQAVPPPPGEGPAVPGSGAAGSGGDGGRRSRERKPHRKAPWWELPALVALAIVIAIVVKTFLVQPFYIPSESMERTLHGCPGCSGDRILVSKIVYDFRDPHPGDIVVFNAPPGWNDEPPSVPPSNPVLRGIRGFGQLVGFVPPDGLVLVKRVIATGGQTVKGDASGHVFVSDNGTRGPYHELNETYVYETGSDPRAKFGPITVPKNRLWVMGDHRDRSADSRYHCGNQGQDGPDNATCNRTAATVPVGDVIGKAFVIAWPPSRWTTLGTPKTFTSSAAGVAAAGMIPFLGVFPVFFVRRRRRRS